MFPTLKELDLRNAVETHGGDLDKAIDELQNLQYLEETGQRPKGVDGLLCDDTQGWKRPKGKKRTGPFLYNRVFLGLRLPLQRRFGGST